jgi:hypothetical protein
VAEAVFDGARVIAHAIVDDPDQAAVLDVNELNRDGAGPGVLAHVRQSLPDVPVYQQVGTVRGVGTQPVIQPVSDPGLTVHSLQVHSQGSPQAAVFQARRPEVKDQLAQVTDGQAEGLLKLVQDLLRRLIAEPEPELLQPHAGRRHHLDGVVMYVSGDTGALFLPSQDETPEQGLAVPAFRQQ